MELRNGRRYFPELEYHYSYSFSLRANKKSPKLKVNKETRDYDIINYSRHQNYREKTNIGGHSATLQLRVPEVKCAAGRSGMQVVCLQDKRKSNYSKQKEQIETSKLFGSVIEKNDSMQAQKGLTVEKQNFKNAMISSNIELSASQKTNVLTYETFSENKFGEIYQKKNGYHAKENVISVTTSTPITETASRRTSFHGHSSSSSSSLKISSETNGSYYSRKRKTEKILKRYSNTSLQDNGFQHSLEDHIFHDTSLKKVYYEENNKKYSYDDTQSSQEKDESINYLYKLNGSYLSQFSDASNSDSENPSSYINHYRRSLYRQKRRDWYLNRRNPLMKNKNYISSIIHHYLLIFKVLFLSIFHKTFKIFHAMKEKFLYQENSFYFHNGQFIQKKHQYSKTNWMSLQGFVFWISSSVTNILYEVITYLFIFFSKTGHITVGKLSICFVMIKTLCSSCLGFSRTFADKLINLFCFLKTFIKDSLKLFLFNFMGKEVVFDKEKISDDDSDVGILPLTPFCCLSFVLVIGMVPVLLFLLAIFSQVSVSIVPDPNQLAISTSRTIFLGTSGNSIPAWHFMPPSAEYFTQGSVFADKSPVTLFLRENRDLNSKLQGNIFKTLVSLGYHVIVPIDILNDEEVTIAWSWIKQKARLSSTYLWGEHLDSNTLTGYAKDFCTQLIPPDGVIIETEVKNPQYSHRSLEIWSCNCTYVKSKKEDREYHKYTHVKCPLSELDVSLEQLYNHIVSCIAAVNRDEQ